MNTFFDMMNQAAFLEAEAETESKSFGDKLSDFIDSKPGKLLVNTTVAGGSLYLASLCFTAVAATGSVWAFMGLLIFAGLTGASIGMVLSTLFFG